jgi:hypothetical protein
MFGLACALLLNSEKKNLKFNKSKDNSMFHKMDRMFQNDFKEMGAYLLVPNQSINRTMMFFGLKIKNKRTVIPDV